MTLMVEGPFGPELLQFALRDHDGSLRGDRNVDPEPPSHRPTTCLWALRIEGRDTSGDALPGRR